jgi:hypothetical protein
MLTKPIIAPPHDDSYLARFYQVVRQAIGTNHVYRRGLCNTWCPVADCVQPPALFIPPTIQILFTKGVSHVPHRKSSGGNRCFSAQKRAQSCSHSPYHQTFWPARFSELFF